MRQQKEFSVLAYVYDVPDSERTWTGMDEKEATKVLAMFMTRWPNATVRFDEATYYLPDSKSNRQ